MYVTRTWKKPLTGIVTILLKSTDVPVVREDFLTSVAWKIMIYNYAIASKYNALIKSIYSVSFAYLSP